MRTTYVQPKVSGVTPGSLRSRSILAFLWGGGGAIVRLVVQVGAQVVLARILGPEQYGLFAVGVIVVSFSNYFSDLGIAYGLIQRQEVRADHIRFVLTWQVIIGSLVSFILLLSASSIASFFRESRIEAIIYGLAPVCALQATSAVSLNLLKRSLNYRAIQIAQVGGYFIGYVVVAIPMALHGYQVWSLVWAWGVQVTASLVMLYWFVRHPLKPKLTHDEGSEMTSFGFKVLATNLLNWAVANIDRVIVARAMPTHVVGLYSTSYNLMYTPSTAVMGVIQPVLYSTCSRMEGDRSRIRDAYLTMAAAVCAGLMPIYAFVAVNSETCILALYGMAWKEAAPVLAPVALAMPLYYLWNITTPPLWTSGRATDEVKLQAPMAILWLIAIAIAVQFSVVAVAWTVFGLFAVRYVAFAWVLGRIISLTANQYWLAVRGGLLLSVVFATCAGGLDAILTRVGVGSALTRLLVDIAACVLVGLLVLRGAPGLLYPSLVSALIDTASRVSPQLAVLLRALLRTKALP